MRFGIIEVGSTTTKAYLYDKGYLKDLGSRYIPFKTNYKTDGKLRENDVESLYSFVDEVLCKTKDVHVFGTSIFRNLKDDEREKFLADFLDNYGFDFRIVTADEESLYTVKGVLSRIDYQKRMAVAIGGGGSTEIAIIDKGEIVKRLNLPFGAMDVTEAFPDLKEDIAKSSFDEILEYTSQLVGDLDDDVEVLVLAGGNYIYFYETVGYEMQRNEEYDDDNQPYILPFDMADAYDRDIMSKSLNDIKKKCPGNESWWDGARGMRFCMNAVARKVRADYIVPTKINMLIGLADEISKK